VAPTAVVRRGEIVAAVRAPGTIEPVEIVDLKSQTPGMVRDVRADVGADVRAGDVLAQLDPRDLQNELEQAQADLDAAQAAMKEGEEERVRAEDLYGANALTAEGRDSVQVQLAQVAAQVVTARANLDVAQFHLDQATVRAPFAGTILARNVSAGAVVTSATGAVGGGTTLFQIADLNRLRVRVEVNETDVASLRLGAPAEILVDAYPQRPFRGVVEKFEPAAVVDQDVTMFVVLVSLPNSDRVLMPGMNGDVSIFVRRRENVATVPLEALNRGRDLMVFARPLGVPLDTLKRYAGTSLALVLSGDSAELRAVRVGDESPSDAEVVSGVSPGDTVLLIAGTNMTQDSVALRARHLLFLLDSTRH
jgi:HlyD family secretion protein